MTAPPPADDREVTLRSRFLLRLEGAIMIAVGLAAAAALAVPTLYLMEAWARDRMWGVEPWAVLCAAAGFALGGSWLGGFLVVRGVWRFRPKNAAPGEAPS